MCQPQLLQPLRVVEQLLEVSADGVVAQVEAEQRAQAHEDVVREDRQAVVRQAERHQAQAAGEHTVQYSTVQYSTVPVGEHGGVKVLDLVVGEVEVAETL